MYLTQKQFADIFQISVQTVKHLREDKIIDYIKLAKFPNSELYQAHIRIHKDEVQKYKEFCEKETKKFNSK